MGCRWNVDGNAALRGVWDTKMHIGYAQANFFDDKRKPARRVHHRFLGVIPFIAVGV
jgi:hypothetical protein